MTKKVFASVGLCALLLIAGGVHAADLRVAEKNGNVHIAENDIIKNLYTAGNIVTIDASTLKGVRAAGNVVNVNGDIGESAYLAGGTVIVSGDVRGSLHSAGGSVVVESVVVDDLMIGGGNVSVGQSASVGEDLYIAGGVVDLQGTVSGDVYIAGGEVTINSEIGGNVTVRAEKITLGDNARINGNLSYRSEKEIDMSDGATVLGETTILEKHMRHGDDANTDKAAFVSVLFALISFALFVKLLGLIAFGLILVWLFKKPTEKIVHESLVNFWRSLVTGFILLVVVPMLVIVLFVSVIGIWLGVVVSTIYVLSLMLAGSLAPVALGSFVVKAVRKRSSYYVNWKSVVAGVVLMLLLGFIPLLGGLLYFVLMLISLGALYRVVYRATR